MHRAAFTVILLLLASASPARARIPTLVDGRFGDSVREVRHDVRIQVEGFVAETEVTLTLRSASAGAEEAIVRIATPSGAVITGLEVQLGARTIQGRRYPAEWVKGTLLPARAVRAAIRVVKELPEVFDPAWLEQVEPDLHRLRVYPVPPTGEVRVRYTYLAPVTLRWGRRVVVYPRRGTEKNLVAALVEITDRGSATTRQQVRVPPSLALERALTDPAIRGPVRAALLVAPPDKPGGRGQELVIVQGNPEAGRRPQGTDLVVLVDRSRSMWKGHERTVQATLEGLLTELGITTRFTLVSFHRRATVHHAAPVAFTAAAVKDALARLRTAADANGTDVAAGLKAALAKVPAARPGRRRLLVILTDGLLPERGQEITTWPRVPAGVEVVALVGRPFFGVTQPLTEGPLALLARTQGGVAYTFDPDAEGDGTAEGDERSVKAVERLAAALARPGRLTQLALRVDGQPRDLAQQELALLGGFQLRRPFAGTPPGRAELSFGHQGQRQSVLALAQPMPRRTAEYLALRSADGRDRGVSRRRSLVAIDPRDAFGVDRLRFARRWGGRFFQRMAPPGSLDLHVGDPDATGPGDPTRTAAQPRFRGQLTRDLVRDLLRNHYVKAATRCYQATGPAFRAGELVLQLDLTRGEVADAWIGQATLADAGLQQCLVAAALDLRVPHSWGDETLYRVHYPMRFRPEDRSVKEIRDWRPPPPPRDTNPLRGLR